MSEQEQQAASEGGIGQPASTGGLGWHHPDCEGACLACLIEALVLEHYGTQGLNFLRRKVGAGDTQPKCGNTPYDEGQFSVLPNVEFSGGAPLHGAASAGTQG